MFPAFRPLIRTPRRVLAVLAAFSGAALPGHAADPAPPSALVRLYEPGHAQIKDAVRSVTVADNGSLIVGSNVLSVFNGYTWTRLNIPRAYGFRALAVGRSHRVGNTWVRSDRVWVGAIDHLGYLERNDVGDWQFIAMARPGTADFPSTPIGDVWSVHAVGDDNPVDTVPTARNDGAVWITTDKVIRWDGARFEIWQLPAPTHLTGFSNGNSALVYQDGTGLLKIGLHGAPQCVVTDAELPAKPVAWYVPSADDSGGIVGLHDSAYAWDGGSGWNRLEPLSTVLHGTLPIDAVRLDQQRIAIATFNSGIVLAQTDGTILGHITPREGLPENSVYSITAVHDQLFAGLLSGLAQIDGAGQATFFKRRASFNGGSPRRVLVHQDRTLVLATNGLYQVTDGGLRTLFTHSTPWWDATTLAGELWIGGFGGVWRERSGRIAHELEVPMDVLQLTATAQQRNALLLTEGYGLNLLRPAPPGSWENLPLETATKDTPISLLEDRAGDIWLSTVNAGIGRFRWVPRHHGAEPQIAMRARYRPGAGLPRDAANPILVPFGRRIYAFVEQAVLEFDAEQDLFLPEREMGDFIAVAASPAGTPSAQYWIVRPKSLAQFGTYALLRVTQSSEGVLSFDCLDAPGIDQIGTVEQIDRTAGSGEPVLWISGSRGLLRLNESTLRQSVTLQWPELATTAGEGSAARTGKNGTLQFVPTARRVRFSFVSADAALGEPVYYQTRLDGAEADWSAPVSEPSREFLNLTPGGYSFSARTVDRFGRPGPVVTASFVILTPWWRRPEAYALDAVLVLAGVALGVRWRLRALQRQNEKLNQLVSERTQELELSNTAKSEFLENISHEIRNPLNGLTGLLSLMREEQFAPRERNLARSLKASAATLTRVFEDVLEFSKLEYGYGKLRLAPFSLRGALGDLLMMYTPLAEKHRCGLTLDWPTGLADGFEGDAERIKTIVGNFVSNAFKYAPGTPVEIRVTATGETNGMVDLYIEVTDHGPGIPPDEQGLIFRKFVRGSNAKRQEIAGTGLGLATCHALARMMNGQVGVESTPGRGAMFYVRLLLRRTELPSPIEPSRAILPAPGAPVLIVDDEDYNRTVLEGIVQQLGFNPDVAADAQQAAERVATRDYSVLFLDWELPGPKGGALAQQVRQGPSGDRPLIIATTGHDSDDMRTRCHAAGMDGFLPKPFDAHSVRRAIERATRERSPANGSSIAVPSTPPPDPAQSSERPPARGLEFSAFAHYNRIRPGAAGPAFAAALDDHRDALVQAVAASDLATIANIAHRLRALAGMINANELNTAAARLEQSARSGSARECAAMAASIQDACAELRVRVLAAEASVAATPGATG